MPKIKFQIGRKRKSGPREPNGRLERERAIDPKAIAQLMPHRRLVPADAAHDPKAESLLGRLQLNGWLSVAQWQAGESYWEIVNRYRAVIDAPRGEVSMNGVIVGPWGGGMTITDDEAKRRKDNFNAAFEAMHSAAGHRGAVAVSHCLHGKNDFALRYLKCGLDALAEHLGLTNRRKAGLSQK